MIRVTLQRLGIFLKMNQTSTIQIKAQLLCSTNFGFLSYLRSVLVTDCSFFKKMEVGHLPALALVFQTAIILIMILFLFRNSEFPEFTVPFQVFVASFFIVLLELYVSKDKN